MDLHGERRKKERKKEELIHGKALRMRSLLFVIPEKRRWVFNFGEVVTGKRKKERKKEDSLKPGTITYKESHITFPLCLLLI